LFNLVVRFISSFWRLSLEFWTQIYRFVHKFWRLYFLCFLISFSFVWEDKSITQDSVSSHFQTPRSSSKILRYASKCGDTRSVRYSTSKIWLGNWTVCFVKLFYKKSRFLNTQCNQKELIKAKLFSNFISNYTFSIVFSIHKRSLYLTVNLEMLQYSFKILSVFCLSYFFVWIRYQHYPDLTTWKVL